MNCGVVVFPGSNCDHDVYHVLGDILGAPVRYLWHQSDSVEDCELVVVPGGFSYGDYLRAGSMASLSPIMLAISSFAARGGLVLGICNGFQILLEAGLLPGAMRHNRDLRFLSRDVFLRVERNDLPFTCQYEVGQVVRMPIAHAEGNYVDTERGIEQLERGGQVVFRYCNEAGELTESANPNGSIHSIAGICNEGANVCALMPHPERCAEDLLSNTDGLALFAGALGGAVARATAGAAS